MFDITRVLKETEKAIDLAKLYVKRRQIVWQQCMAQLSPGITLRKKDWLPILERLNEEKKLDIAFRYERNDFTHWSAERDRWDVSKVVDFIRQHDAIRLDNVAYFGADEFDGNIYHEDEYVAIYGYSESDWNRGDDSIHEMIYLKKEWLNCLANEGVETFDAIYASYASELIKELHQAVSVTEQEKKERVEREAQQAAEEKLAHERALYEKLKTQFEPSLGKKDEN